MHQQTKRQRKNFARSPSVLELARREATIPDPGRNHTRGRERCELRLSSSYERRKHDDGPLGSRSSSASHATGCKSHRSGAGTGMRKVRSADAASRSAKHETVFANHNHNVDVKDTFPARGRRPGAGLPRRSRRSLVQTIRRSKHTGARRTVKNCWFISTSSGTGPHSDST